MIYLVREDDGAVAVGLEVHPNVEVEGRVVEVLHAGRHARHGDVLKLGGKTKRLYSYLTKLGNSRASW